MFYRPENGHGLPHNPFNAIVTPRPIGWISTRGAAGDNLAPYSFFNGVAYTPPQVVFSSTEEKDSLRNLRETGVFAVNVVAATETTETPVITAFGEVQSARTLEIRAATGGNKALLESRDQGYFTVDMPNFWERPEMSGFLRDVRQKPDRYAWLKSKPRALPMPSAMPQMDGDGELDAILANLREEALD